MDDYKLSAEDYKPLDDAYDRIRRVISGEDKLLVYPYPVSNAHDMIKLGHAEYSYYNDIECIALGYPMLRARISELEHR